MVIICPHCQQEHTIDASKLPANVTKVRCKTCKELFEIDKPKSSQPIPSSDAKKQLGPRKIAVTLSKGGVGKTTTAVNLAAGLALAGFKVLLVDTDTQGQSSFMLGVKPKAGLTEFVNDELSLDETMIQVRDRLWLLAGGKSLAGLKRVIDRKDFGGEMTLNEKLSTIDKQFDYVIIDTSPGWDPLIVNVLFYAEEVLTPVSLEVLRIISPFRTLSRS